MAPTNINNLYALAKGLRAAFLQYNSHNAKYVLQNNTHLLTNYYYARAKDWEKLINPNPLHYNKTWVPISLNNTPFNTKTSDTHILPFGIAVLTWLPGQMTNIHGHPENGCIMMPLHGTLTEERFNIAEPISLTSNGVCPTKNLSVQKEIRIIMPGQAAFINDTIGYHQVKNNSNTLAVSLHVYSPGI